MDALGETGCVHSMARLARLVLRGMPHHVTHEATAASGRSSIDGDCEAYLELMTEWSRKQAVEIWSYCLMPNHLIASHRRRTAYGDSAVPEEELRDLRARPHRLTTR